MADLLITFGIPFPHYPRPGSAWLHPNGPLFHRWLPDGDQDAISLNTHDPNVVVKVWFTRRGYVENGIIHYDHSRREVDPGIIPKQAILDGGPLLGSLQLVITDQEAKPLKDAKQGDKDYIALGNRVLNLLVPTLTSLLTFLRITFGQYWLHMIDPWDRKPESLGSYCNSLFLKWSLDGGINKTIFQPTELNPLVFQVPVCPWDQYLTQKEWKDTLPQLCNNQPLPPISAALLIQTHRLVRSGQLKHAFVEGVSALEVAVDDFLKGLFDGASGKTKKAVQSIHNPTLPAKVAMVARIKNVPVNDVEATLEAIKIRNKIVHEVDDPEQDSVLFIKALMRTLQAIIPGHRIKFPIPSSGNAIKSVESWEQDKK